MSGSSLILQQRLSFPRSSSFCVSYFLVRLYNPTRGTLQALVKQFDDTFSWNEAKVHVCVRIKWFWSFISKTKSGERTTSNKPQSASHFVMTDPFWRTSVIIIWADRLAVAENYQISNMLLYEYIRFLQYVSKKRPQITWEISTYKNSEDRVFVQSQTKVI